jgi:hypothetical protein
LEELLAKDGPRLGVNNTARAGYDLPRIIDVYETHAQRRYYPLVIYGFVLNDFGLPDRDSIIGSDFIDFNSGEYAVSPWRQRFSTVNFVGHVMDTIRLDRSTKKAYLAAFEGINAERGYELLIRLNRRIEENGGKLVIVLFPLLYDFHDYPFQTIHDKIAANCQRARIPLLDLLPAFSRYRAEELWVHPVDHHPNEIAHRIAAEEIHAFLKRQGLLAATLDAVLPVSDGRSAEARIDGE